MQKKKKIKRFRRISHPRKDLKLSEDYIEYIKFYNKSLPDVNPEAVYMEFLNYFDPYDVGLDTGNKAIRHVPDRDTINSRCFRWVKRPKNTETDSFIKKLWKDSIISKDDEAADIKINPKKVYEHITKQKKWYYTSNPFCQIRVLGGDIDNETSNPDAVLPFLSLLQDFYPGAFHDDGSSGKSLHYYPKIDMLLLYEYYINNPSITVSWAKYANDIIKHTGRIFQIYGKNILCPEHKLVLKTQKNGKSQLKPEYFVKFDAFKGTYPEYDFYYNKKNELVRKEMLKSGVLHKYPNIFTIEDLIAFRDAPVYSIVHHLSVSMYLCYQVLLSGCYSDKDYKKLCEARKEIEPVLEAYSVLMPMKNATQEVSSLMNSQGRGEDNKILCIYNGTFENVNDIALEPDAMIRSRRYLYYCFMEYMLNEGREPSVEEYIRDYRQDVGTGPEDAEDVIRLEYIYDTNLNKMRSYTFGSLSQQIKKMEDALPVSQEKIDNLNKSYHRRIWKREVAIAAVWISLCLTNTNYLEKKKWWSKYKSEHYDRELTVPMNSLENFIECLKEKGLNKNGCKDNHTKAKALREILEGISWIQCVDDTVVIAAHNDDKGGRSRRYILLPSHPCYSQFEKTVRPERIEYWLEARERQVAKRERSLAKRMAG